MLDDSHNEASNEETPHFNLQANKDSFISPRHCMLMKQIHQQRPSRTERVNDKKSIFG